MSVNIVTIHENNDNVICIYIYAHIESLSSGTVFFYVRISDSSRLIKAT